MDVIVDVSDIVLENDKYRLRIFNKNDLLDYFEYASVVGVGELAGWPHHESLEMSVNFLNCFIKDKNVLAIVRKDISKVIGSFSIQKVNYTYFNEFKANKVVEIGYCLSKDYWNKGIMTNILTMMLDYLKDYDIEYFLVRCYDYNYGSQKVILKNNFKEYKKVDNFILYYKYNKA